MGFLIKDASLLLKKAIQENLYLKLLVQLNKDFGHANIPISFDLDCGPEKLKMELHETIFKLINDRFEACLNLLYIVDVQEKQVKQLDGADTVKLSEEITFLILKREWQKVWYKNKYGT